MSTKREQRTKIVTTKREQRILTPKENKECEHTERTKNKRGNPKREQRRKKTMNVNTKRE